LPREGKIQRGGAGDNGQSEALIKGGGKGALPLPGKAKQRNLRGVAARGVPPTPGGRSESGLRKTGGGGEVCRNLRWTRENAPLAVVWGLPKEKRDLSVGKGEKGGSYFSWSKGEITVPQEERGSVKISSGLAAARGLHLGVNTATGPA